MDLTPTREERVPGRLQGVVCGPESVRRWEGRGEVGRLGLGVSVVILVFTSSVVMSDGLSSVLSRLQGRTSASVKEVFRGVSPS